MGEHGWGYKVGAQGQGNRWRYRDGVPGKCLPPQQMGEVSAPSLLLLEKRSPRASPPPRSSLASSLQPALPGSPRRWLKQMEGGMMHTGLWDGEKQCGVGWEGEGAPWGNGTGLPIPWGWGRRTVEKCLRQSSDPHGKAAVGAPRAFRRQGVGWWSRGGRGGGRAWGGTLHWKQK